MKAPSPDARLRRGKNSAKQRGKTAVPALIPQPHGGALLAGGKPGNAGGGRLTERLFEMGEASADFIEQTRKGEITYTLNEVCEHCGKESTGPKTFGDLLKLIPSPDTRLRAAELPIRYTVGRERVIRVEGFPGAQRVFDIIRSRIRQKLGSGLSEEMLEDIQLALKEEL